MRIIKKIFYTLSFLSFLILPVNLFAADVTWTLAAEKFTFTQKKVDKGPNEATATVIPCLILEQIAENLSRLPRAREQLERTEYELWKERSSLFLQLSKEVQTRDALVLQDYSSGKLKRKIREQEKKIKEVQLKIDENLKSVESERQKKERQIQIDDEREQLIAQGGVVDDSGTVDDFFSQFLKSFVPGKDEPTLTLEKVVLYKNSVTDLFDPGENARKDGHQSFPFIKAAVDANIRGLITGSITIYGSYIAVNIVLYQYPGGRVIGTASDVGNLGELKALGVRLASQITPKISDSMPVKLAIEVTPPEAHKNLVITVDDVVYTENPSEIVVSSGVHFIQFASKGYDTEATSFAFEGNREFKVSVDMQEKTSGTVSLAFNVPIEGNVFAAGKFRSSVGPTQRFSSISVDNHPILGHFVSTDGLPSEFIIERSLLEKDALLTVQAAAFDKSQYIDKRRIWMYRSYSALIISLMPTFFFKGCHEGAVSAYNLGNYTDEAAARSKANTYQLAEYACTGISLTCATWFVYELIRYLRAANTVLPSPAKPMSERAAKKIRTAEEEAKLKAIEEAQLKAIEEAENNKSE